MSWPEPRERAMPLVPQPFSGVSISRQSFFMGNRAVADSWSEFCPNLNIPQYRESLSEKKKTELDERSTKLLRGAICNQLYKSSEFCWDVSAWNDVFGQLYDDERFLMDKRPYEFLEVDDAGKETVKKRIPDATIGLKSYNEFHLRRGYICSVTDCTDDHSTIQPDDRLSEENLQAMMHNPECGLIVDGVWGKTELLFPFAVYEAKKTAQLHQQAEDQIYHACRTYLAMLDDLARNPDNVAEYQTKESSKYQLFAFASCGSYWQVFIASNRLDSCLVETIWEGDVKDFSRAFELICIVDQIRIMHKDSDLGAFSFSYIRGNPYDVDKYSDMGYFDSDDSDISSDSYGVDEISELLDFDSNKHPEWLRLKEQSKIARNNMLNETRKRNKRLRVAQGSKAAKELKKASELEKTRPRGLHPKNRVAKKNAPKHGRGKLAKTASKTITVALTQHSGL
ncbi:hypothetical protein V502_01364 [Pseudogymnoascus sp. VKM F-4520 (FW-2644)]|nr:hypothetical protein V502_01364 [Pseudogymnoascus sp. VKM F-4520 (FW-2644)]